MKVFGHAPGTKPSSFILSSLLAKVFRRQYLRVAELQFANAGAGTLIPARKKAAGHHARRLRERNAGNLEAELRSEAPHPRRLELGGAPGRDARKVVLLDRSIALQDRALARHVQH